MGHPSVLKFSITVVGDTRESTLERIDRCVGDILIAVEGEPWVVVSDEIKKVPIAADLSDPQSFAYLAEQLVVFGGPSQLGKSLSEFRDGFRPQGGFDSS